MWVDYADYGPENLKPGDKLRVVRLPVLWRSDPPAERESIKTIVDVNRRRKTLVRLKEHTTREGGVKMLRTFEAGPRELTSGPPRPLRFEILEVLPSIVIEEER